MTAAGEKYYRRNPHTAWQVLEEGGMILNLKANEMSATNPTGAWIWQQLDEPVTVRQLSAALSQEFEVTPEEAQAAIEAYLAELEAKSLVEVTQQGEAGA
ncbi:MAG TPA: PqqD family protein [Chloroflexia bacterium]|nr:PqqD family protein [Chloroflexia bacterium]